MSTQDAEAAQPLNALDEGFRAYRRPHSDEWKAAYTEGLIVLDTNAILELYRFSPQAREEYMKILRRLSDRIFIPHRVALEFHRRRVDAVTAHRSTLTKVMEDVSKHAQLVTESINRLGKNRATPERLKQVTESIVQIEAFGHSIVAEYDLDPRDLADGKDPLLDELNRLFIGRVGPRLESKEYDKDVQEGKRRTADKIPPGFEDSKKTEDINGDYLWWAELLRNPMKHDGPVIIVTNEEKIDWIYKPSGHRIGPLPQLYDELLEKTGNPLLITRVQDLLRYSPEFLDTEQVSASTLAEASEIADQSDLPLHRQAFSESVSVEAAATYLGTTVSEISTLIVASTSSRAPAGYVSFNDLVRASAAKILVADGLPLGVVGRDIGDLSDHRLREIVIAFDKNDGMHYDTGSVNEVTARAGMNKAVSFKSLMERQARWWVEQRHHIYYHEPL